MPIKAHSGARLRVSSVFNVTDVVSAEGQHSLEKRAVAAGRNRCNPQLIARDLNKLKVSMSVTSSPLSYDLAMTACIAFHTRIALVIQKQT